MAIKQLGKMAAYEFAAKKTRQSIRSVMVCSSREM